MSVERLGLKPLHVVTDSFYTTDDTDGTGGRGALIGAIFVGL